MISLNFYEQLINVLNLALFFTVTVLSLTCYCSWCPFRAPGLLSTLCTAFYALVGMLLRGGKTVEGRKFLQDSKFRLLFTVILYARMFVTVTYLFLL